MLKELKKKTHDIILSEKQILVYFNKFFIQNMDEIYTKFRSYNNIIEILDYSCKIIFNIFWIVYNYSNNIFITLFLAEKSILLFTEFIILSNDTKIVKDLYYKPNIIDALNFSYKKTIYSIMISSLNTKFNKTVINCCLLVKDFLKISYMQKVNNEKIEIDNEIILKHILNIYNRLNDKIFFMVYNYLIDLLNNMKRKEMLVVLDTIKKNKKIKDL